MREHHQQPNSTSNADGETDHKKEPLNTRGVLEKPRMFDDLLTWQSVLSASLGLVVLILGALIYQHIGSPKIMWFVFIAIVGIEACVTKVAIDCLERRRSPSIPANATPQSPAATTAPIPPASTTPSTQAANRLGDLRESILRLHAIDATDSAKQDQLRRLQLQVMLVYFPSVRDGIIPALEPPVVPETPLGPVTLRDWKRLAEKLAGPMLPHPIQVGKGTNGVVYGDPPIGIAAWIDHAAALVRVLQDQVTNAGRSLSEEQRKMLKAKLANYTGQKFDVIRVGFTDDSETANFAKEITIALSDCGWAGWFHEENIHINAGEIRNYSAGISLFAFNPKHMAAMLALKQAMTVAGIRLAPCFMRPADRPGNHDIIEIVVGPRYPIG